MGDEVLAMALYVGLGAKLRLMQDSEDMEARKGCLLLAAALRRLGRKLGALWDADFPPHHGNWAHSNVDEMAREFARSLQGMQKAQLAEALHSHFFTQVKGWLEGDDVQQRMGALALVELLSRLDPERRDAFDEAYFPPRSDAA